MRAAFSFMSLSLTMIASTNEGLRSYFLAEVATASAIRPHCDGVQAGVCQRILSFTEQIVCARQALACTSPPGSGSVSPGVVAGVAVDADVDAAGMLAGEPASAREGAKLAK